MKILFSNPPWWLKKRSRRTGKFELARGVRAGSRWPFTHICYSRPGQRDMRDYTPFPHFLASATTFVARKLKCDTMFRDSVALAESYATYFAHLKQEKYDAIVIEVQTPSYDHDIRLIGKIKNLLPRIKIIVAGPVVVDMVPGQLAELGIYAATKGEYDRSVLTALDSPGKIVDYDILSEDDMNNAPFPYMDYLHQNLYWDATPKGSKRPQFWFWTSRGCPFKCNFCVWPASMTNNDPLGTGHRKVRYYSSEYVRAYLDYILHRFEYHTLFVDDDTFNLGDKHTLAMCKVLKETGLLWNALCRPDTISLATWKTMKESNCFGVRLGFESGSQGIIDNVINKRLNLKRAAGVTKYLRKIGLFTHGAFTVGHPTETPEQMQQTIEYARSIGLNSFQVAGVGVLAGSPLGQLLKDKKRTRQYKDFLLESNGDSKAVELGFETTYYL